MQLFESLSTCFGNGADAKLNSGGCGWQQVGPIINELLKNLILVGISIAVAMIMYAGYVLVQGQGSDSARTKARHIFMGIVIGLFLLVGSYYIVEFVLDTFNVKAEYRDNVLPKK